MIKRVDSMKNDEVIKLIESYGDGSGGILNLSGRNLSTLPSEIGRLVRLKTLILNNNLLTELPPEIGNMHDLLHLQLKDNHLQGIPTSLARLPNLWYVNLSGNRFIEFPLTALNLPALLHLDISDNRLKELPVELYQKTKLQALEIQNNRLKHLSNKIINLTSLRILDISNNQLVTLPFDLKDAHDLATTDSWVHVVFFGNPLLIPTEALGMDNKEDFWDFGWFKYFSVLEQNESSEHFNSILNHINQLRMYANASKDKIAKLYDSPQGNVILEHPRQKRGRA